MKEVINAVFYTIILVFPFLNYSCGKTEFKRKLIIKVTDSIYHRPIKNCSIHVEQDNGNNTMVFGERQYWDGVTNEEGIAVWEFKPYENIGASGVEINVGLSCLNGYGGGCTYYSTGQIINQKDLKIGKNCINFSFPPLGLLNISIKNSNPYNDSDLFEILGIGSCCISERLVGKEVNTIFKFNVSPDRVNIISWYVTKNNMKTDYKDSIYCPAFDTAYYTIKY